MTDKGIEALKGLPLEELTLDSTDVTDKGAELLAGISTLKSLDLYHTLVSEQGHRKIKTSLPACSIFLGERLRTTHPQASVTMRGLLLSVLLRRATARR